jgi:hypothetical protein
MGIEGVENLKPQAEETEKPSLSGKPVVLIHLESPAGSGLAICCGEPFNQPTDEYQNYPQVLCPACGRLR